MHTVLVIDDEEGFLQIIKVVLQRAGYRTLAANNGTTGLELVYEHAPDIIILDDMMPGISGGEVCMQLKNDPQTRHIPIVMYSAGAKVRNPAYIKQIGADGALFKPALPAEILETISTYLGAG